MLVRIPACPACPLSDYKFISETPDDVVRRLSLFCRPLGSATHSTIVTSSGTGNCVSTTDSNGGSPVSSDSELGPTATEVEEILVVAATSEDDGEGISDDAEPIFDATCLDIELERTCVDGECLNLPHIITCYDFDIEPSPFVSALLEYFRVSQGYFHFKLSSKSQSKKLRN